MLDQASNCSMLVRDCSENWSSNSIDARSNIVSVFARPARIIGNWCSNLLDARKIDASSNAIFKRTHLQSCCPPSKVLATKNCSSLTLHICGDS